MGKFSNVIDAGFFKCTQMYFFVASLFTFLNLNVSMFS